MKQRAGTSPIRERTSEQERSLLGAVSARAFRSVVVVSDLHLGEGRDAVTGLYGLTENFAADDAFARFLDHERREHPAGLLVLLGDTFDFLRITRAPETDGEYAAWASWLERLGRKDRAADLPRPLTWVERRYGLRTQDWKTLWKLLVVLEGHAPTPVALSRWLGSGGSIVVAKGNHDVELHWPLVRRAIRDALMEAGASAEAAENSVAFADGGFCVGELYLEHGHQYEGMTRVVGPPVLPGRASEINLPLGSFVNRYFINQIERLDPLVDNRKPVQQALMALLRRRPAEIVRIYSNGLRFLGKSVAHLGSRQGLAATCLVLLFYLPLIALPIAAAWLFWPQARERILAWLPFLDVAWIRRLSLVGGSIAPLLLPYALGLVRDAGRALGLVRDRDHLAEGASVRLQEQFPRAPSRRLYAVMGHTHRQTVKVLPRVDGEALYVNTGTWIPLWPADRPDLAGRVIYSVSRFERSAEGAWVHEALEWNDDAGALRPLDVLTTSGGG